MVAFHAVLDPGDEAIFSEPAWFCYEPLLLAAAAVPRKVNLRPPAFDLDLEAIDAAISPKTRLVVVNSPHNPTGRIYSRDTLERLADLLEHASGRIGRRIYLLSDEPYRRLRFDGQGLRQSRRLCIRGRSSRTATARSCWPRGRDSATWRSRRSCRTRTVVRSAIRCSLPRWRSAGVSRTPSCSTPFRISRRSRSIVRRWRDGVTG